MASLHFDALYEIGEDQRISRGPGANTAPPRFHLFRTAEANYWVVSAELPEGLTRELGELLAAEPVISDFERMAPDLDAIRRLLSTDREPTNEYRGPAFVFPDELPSTEGVEFIARADDPRIGGDYDWLANEVEDVQPAAAIVVDGVIASLCCSVPGSDAAEASLSTAEEHRGRGYAVSVTAAWAKAMRGAGRIPLYSTSWENAASRSVARKLGLGMYGEDWHIE